MCAPARPPRGAGRVSQRGAREPLAASKFVPPSVGLRPLAGILPDVLAVAVAAAAADAAGVFCGRPGRGDGVKIVHGPLRAMVFVLSWERMIRFCRHMSHEYITFCIRSHNVRRKCIDIQKQNVLLS